MYTAVVVRIKLRPKAVAGFMAYQRQAHRGPIRLPQGEQSRQRCSHAPKHAETRARRNQGKYRYASQDAQRCRYSQARGGENLGRGCARASETE